MLRWNNKNTATSGTAPRMAEAIVSAYRMPKAPCTVARPTGTVIRSGLVSTSSGQSRSFQEVTKVKMAKMVKTVKMAKTVKTAKTAKPAKKTKMSMMMLPMLMMSSKKRKTDTVGRVSWPVTAENPEDGATLFRSAAASF